jgi:hypothetical protein
MFHLIEYVGNHSIELTQIVSIVCLFYSGPNYLWLGVYILGFFISTFINRTLKKMLNPKMPSGHFQSIFYSIVFVFLVIHETNPVLFNKFWKYAASLYFIAAFSCFYNCIEFHYHSVLQILSGSALGYFLGASIYRLGRLLANSH